MTPFSSASLTGSRITTSVQLSARSINALDSCQCPDQRSSNARPQSMFLIALRASPDPTSFVLRVSLARQGSRPFRPHMPCVLHPKLHSKSYGPLNSTKTAPPSGSFFVFPFSSPSIFLGISSSFSAFSFMQSESCRHSATHTTDEAAFGQGVLFSRP